MKLFKSRKNGTEASKQDVALSLDDAKLREDLEDMVEEQQKQLPGEVLLDTQAEDRARQEFIAQQAKKEAELAQQMQAQKEQAVREHNRLVDDAEAELTDQTLAHIYLRLAREMLMKESDVASKYVQITRLAIAYARMGEVQEALELVDLLDLPTDHYTQTLKWHKVVYNFNPLRWERYKDKDKSLTLLRWNFADHKKENEEYTYTSNYAFDQKHAIPECIQSTASYHEFKFAQQMGFDIYSLQRLTDMSPKEYVLAAIAYYSGWQGGISSQQNVEFFAKRLKTPAEDFDLYNANYTYVYEKTRERISQQYEKAYDVLYKSYLKTGPSVLKNAVQTGKLVDEFGHDLYIDGKESRRLVIMKLIIEIAEQKYRENPTGVVDNKDKELVERSIDIE